SEVIEARMYANSKLLPRAKIELRDDETVYEHTCSDLISTPDCSFLLIGCKGGEVLLVRITRSEIPVTSLDFTVIMREEGEIEKISIFTITTVDIKEMDKLLFSVMKKDTVSVYSLVLKEGEESIALLK
ncbi:hypothetical protein PFISCL1PPCAC_20812, partial [Pristionchus fissidentatus]